MRKTVLQENENGAMYRLDKIPNTMFNFYILKGRSYKDGTSSYKICVELNADHNKHFTIDTIRGTKNAAVNRLDEIIRHS